MNFLWLLCAFWCCQMTETLAPMNDLSDDESSCTLDDAPPPRPKRKRKHQSSRMPLDDQQYLRSCLAKRSKCSKQNCFEPFVEETKFSELLTFRQEWCALRKLDQDNLVPRHCEILFYFSAFFLDELFVILLWARHHDIGRQSWYKPFFIRLAASSQVFNTLRGNLRRSKWSVTVELLGGARLLEGVETIARYWWQGKICAIFDVFLTSYLVWVDLLV